MNNLARRALVVVGIIALLVFGIRFLIGGPLIGSGPSPSPVLVPSPTVASTTTAAPSPILLTAGEVPAGTYVLHPFLGPNQAISFTFSVPNGWGAGGPSGRAPVSIAPTTGYEGPTGMSLGFLTVDGLEGDPCNWKALPDMQVGPTVEDLASALAAHGGYDSSNPADVTLGGFSGKRIDVEVPADLDLATCDDGQFWVWSGGDGQTIYAQGPAGRFHLWILDVQGKRVIAMTHDFPETSTEDRAEMQTIVDSIRIQP